MSDSMKNRDIKCNVCGIYQVLHKNIEHVFVKENQVNCKKYYFDENDYLVEVNNENTN